MDKQQAAQIIVRACAAYRGTAQEHHLITQALLEIGLVVPDPAVRFGSEQPPSLPDEIAKSTMDMLADQASRAEKRRRGKKK